VLSLWTTLFGGGMCEAVANRRQAEGAPTGAAATWCSVCPALSAWAACLCVGQTKRTRGAWASCHCAGHTKLTSGALAGLRWREPGQRLSKGNGFDVRTHA
jgi:hypothetical protein